MTFSGVCYFDGINYPKSYVLEDLAPISKSDCSLKCKASPGCIYFTYSTSLQRCWLVPLGVPNPNPDITTGVKDL